MVKRFAIEIDDDYISAVLEVNAFFENHTENDIKGLSVGILKTTRQLALLTYSKEQTEIITGRYKDDAKKINFYVSKKLMNIKKLIGKNEYLSQFIDQEDFFINATYENDLDLVELVKEEEPTDFELSIDIEEIERLTEEKNPKPKEPESTSRSKIESLLEKVDAVYQLSKFYRTDWDYHSEPNKLMIRMSEGWLNSLISFVRTSDYVDMAERLQPYVNEKCILVFNLRDNEIIGLKIVDRENNKQKNRLACGDVYKIIRDYNRKEGKRIFINDFDKEIKINFLFATDWVFYYRSGKRSKSLTPEVVYIRPSKEMLFNISEMVDEERSKELERHLHYYIEAKRTFVISSKGGKISKIVILDRDGNEYETTMSDRELELVIRYFNEVENKALYLSDLDVPKTLTRSMTSGVKIIGKDSVELKSFEEDIEIMSLFTQHGLSKFNGMLLSELFLKDFIANFKTHAGFVGEASLSDDAIVSSPNYKIIDSIFMKTVYTNNIDFSQLLQSPNFEFNFKRSFLTKLTKMVNEYYSVCLKYDLTTYFSKEDEKRRAKK